jgi:DNA repair protein RadA
MMEEKKLEDLPGVGSVTAKKLSDAGFSDLMAIATAPVIELSQVAEIGEATAKKIVMAARKALKMGFISGVELLKRREEIGRISTGSEALNQLLGGGVETQAITEMYGEYGSGKTQLGLQLCVNVQLPPEKGGLNGYAVFIDTENTFRPQRILQLAKAVGLDPQEALERIKFARAYSSDHQILLAERIPDLIKKEKIPVKVVVIDSLTGLFRAEYVGRGTLADRQQKLNKYLHFLQRLADRFNLSVYVTNQVLARPDVFFGDPTQAVGGHVLGHAATFRVYLRRSRGERRIARLIDSPCLPEGECVFKITDKGIRD